MTIVITSFIDMFWPHFPRNGLIWLTQFCCRGYRLIYIYLHFTFNLPVFLSFRCASFEQNVTSCWSYYFKSNLVIVIFLVHLHLILYDHVRFSSITIICNTSFLLCFFLSFSLFFLSCWIDYILPHCNYSLYWFRIDVSLLQPMGQILPTTCFCK